MSKNTKILYQRYLEYNICVEFYIKFNFHTNYIKIYKVLGKIKLILDISDRMCQDVNNLAYPGTVPLTGLIVVMLHVSDEFH